MMVGRGRLKSNDRTATTTYTTTITPVTPVDKEVGIMCTVCQKKGAVGYYALSKDKYGKDFNHLIYEHRDEAPIFTGFDHLGHQYSRYRQCFSGNVNNTPLILPEGNKRSYDAETTMKSGIVNMPVYHCNRCNYFWLPRDFDPAYQNIMKMKPPQACARCKSKYWRYEPQRRTKNYSYPASSARIRSLQRSGMIMNIKKTRSKARRI